MKRCLLAGIAILAISLGSFVSVHGQSADTASVSEEALERLRNTVQMPVAVAKAVKAGANTEAMRELSREMIEGKVDPGDFNETMRYGPAISETMGSATEGEALSQFIQKKKNEGLKGRELAEAIHRELNRRGIPAGKKGKRARPVDDDFVPPGLRKNGQGAGPPPGKGPGNKGRTDNKKDSPGKQSKTNRENRENEKAQKNNQQNEAKEKGKKRNQSEEKGKDPGKPNEKGNSQNKPNQPENREKGGGQ